VATIQYLHERKRLGAPRADWSPAFIIAIVLLAVQAVALLLSFFG
jgi:hypothetical protein